MEELFDFIDELLSANLSSADSIEQEALRQLREWLLKFETKEIDGKTSIKQTGSTASIIASAKKELNEIIAGTEYQNLVNSLLTSFDGITDNIGKIHQELNGLSFSKNFLKTNINPIKRLAVQTTAAYLSDTAINANFINPTTRILLEAVQFGYSIPEAERALRDNVRFSKYIGQVARDAMFQYDGTVNNIIRESYGLDGIRYVGSLVNDSRGQCSKWVKMGVIPVEELQKEIAWAKRGGSYKGRKLSGMISGTNEGNFTVYRGGYNCRHRAFPVRL